MATQTAWTKERAARIAALPGWQVKPRANGFLLRRGAQAVRLHVRNGRAYINAQPPRWVMMAMIGGSVAGAVIMTSLPWFDGYLRAALGGGLGGGAAGFLMFVIVWPFARPAAMRLEADVARALG